MLSRLGIRVRRQRRQLQLGPGHQRGQPLRVRVAAAERPDIAHQQDTNGRRGREWSRFQDAARAFRVKMS